jgi:2,4-dienoyl-CoA reductase-like NADH-dependent reductase (Old Yellow Enzyme family)
MTYKVLQPYRINNMKLRNRIMRSATWDGTADERGEVIPDSAAIYRALASGGIGLIVTGYAFVSHPLGQANPGQYGIYNNARITGWKQIVKTVHQQGDSKIAMQIVHAGINSGYLSQKGHEMLAVSKIERVQYPHREMTEDEILVIIDDFTAAALRVKEAGFDAVQLHGAHGYLISQFVSPLYNHRTDRWGGTPANRRCFVLEVIRKIRKAVGDDFPILIKFGVQDDREGGMSFKEGIETCRQMVEAGIDSIEISGGVGNAPLSIKENEIDKTPFRERTAEVKKAVSVPIAVVHGIRSLNMAEDIVASGDADMVSMCRPFIREPQLVLRWEQGDTRTAACISCLKCSRLVARGKPLECVEERTLRIHKSVLTS